MLRDTLFALATLAVMSAACGSPPPPPAPPPPPPVVEAPPPPPPPPPKCEALSEACTAHDGTRATLRATGYTIVIPTGWAYAQQADATVATSASAIFVVTTFDGADAKASGANRDAAFDNLVKLLGVATPKHRPTWSHAAKKSKVGALDMQLWQADDATKGAQKGPMLVFGAELPNKTWLIGAGFVSADDKTDADKAILSAIDSIAPASAP